ncbi:MAG: sensor histidine kinase N-terminal domain-containing protein [Gammaproteobacteria bacterium]|nr:sensor histidine kinase N-terminal domain-containing protein [Gammaproteobacteria bacterium]MBU1414728.1 sensor histidine kinase N-terminal domain-containing protein [Gammaproteobacteria bacterium]
MSTVWFPLRRRLVGLLLGGVTVCWLAMLAWGYVDTRHEIDELMDGQLIIEAHTLLALAAHEADEMAPFKDEYDYQDYEHLGYFRFQIWVEDGRLVMNSPGTPTVALTDVEGFSDAADSDGKNQRWRYYMQWNKKRTVRVIVGENNHVREELIDHALWQMLLPTLMGLPIIGIWVWIAIRRGLRPLNVVADLIAAREPEHLDVLEPETAPEEIRPLVESVNQLFARVEQAIEAEKRFTADAAHELRTPLAALATQAQVALRARDADERSHAIDQLIASSRRAARLVDQLLTLARLDPADAAPSGRVDLARVAEEVCAHHGTLAVDSNVALELDATPTVVSGDPDMLAILVRNLVDNAIRYTPAGGQVTVTVRNRTLSVNDTGPGIPAAERERVFDRFHRLADQEKEGSGLGLSIVARIAERHGAKILLADGDGSVGLRVSVGFP